VEEAQALIAPAVLAAAGARWAELGAGRGTFTRALARLLGAGAEVYAVDRDAAALSALAGIGAREGARVVPLRGDFADDAGWRELSLPPLDGILLANALHFVPAEEQRGVLARLVDGLRPGGRIVVVEYEGRAANPWVPYPVDLAALAALLPPGMAAPVRIGARPSAFGGTLYAACTQST
jgi:SAM-dependent methyltransferase